MVRRAPQLSSQGEEDCDGYGGHNPDQHRPRGRWGCRRNDPSDHVVAQAPMMGRYVMNSFSREIADSDIHSQFMSAANGCQRLNIASCSSFELTFALNTLSFRGAELIEYQRSRSGMKSQPQ